MHPDVVIIGAGVIGTAVAYELSRRVRARVLVIDKGIPGCEASNAAAGLLNVASARARPGALFSLRRVSAEMFPAWVGELEEETGFEVGYRQRGTLLVALTGNEMSALRELVALRVAQGLRAELVDVSTTRAMGAGGTSVVGGAFFADDWSVQSERFVAALVNASQRRGVFFRLGTTVRGLSAAADHVRVRIDDAEIETGHVVVAAGAWSGELMGGCGVKVPVRPARGEMLALRLAGALAGPVLAGNGTYLIPGESNEVLVGSTNAFAGFDKYVTEAGVATLRRRATALRPDLEQAPALRAWAGLRPCATIRRPLIGPLPSWERVLLATGHHRNGILLAPVTATLIADQLLNHPPVVPTRPFSYRKR